jgi:adenylate cyclase
MGREKRRLAAVMFTDIVGYSALSQKNEKLALELLEDHRLLLRPQFQKYNGKEIKTIGDAFLVEFQSAVEAVECAIVIQKELQASSALLPPEKRIQVRIGIHVGDIVHREGDIYGDGVNIASRIQPLAEPGGICLSEQVVDQVRNKIKAPIVSLGIHSLKNIEDPQKIFYVVLPWQEEKPLKPAPSISLPKERKKRWLAPSLIVAGVLIVASISLLLLIKKGILTPPRPQKIRSLAVLPLQNLSADPTQEYFSDGMTEALITELSKIKALRVISRTSVMRYKKTEKTLPEIAKELNVEAAIEGSALLAGDRVRITAQLVKADPEQHLWAEEYERDFRDILALQSEVARTIAREIRITLTPEEKERLASVHPINPDAHKAYLKGRFLINKFTEDGVRNGMKSFRQALVIDPGFALAHAGLAEAYDILTSAGWISPQEGWPRVQEEAEKALFLDETLGEPRVLLADYKFLVAWDFKGAEQEFQRAIELNPGNSTAHQYYAIFLSAMGRHEEAIEVNRHALELDPLSLSINQSMGAIYRFARQYDLSLQQLKASVGLDPNFAWTYWSLGEAYVHKGMYEKAVNELQKALDLSGENMALIQADLACSFALWGKKKEAQLILEDLHSQSHKKYVSPFSIATIYAALGERDRAFSWLEKAFAERANNLVFLRVDPRLDSLRHDPRFDNFLTRVGLK